ncbi:MAG: hypothetical protein J6N53_03440 [Lachnospiraceae bacterium]|nr:hypothetical protein [Lachnospiraceae bacterium]
MQYRTRRQTFIGLGISFFLSALCLGGWVLLSNQDGEITLVIKAGCIFLGGLLILIYFLSFNTKRNKYKRIGQCIPGRIIGADMVYGRHESSYHLMISFYDNGEKVLYTEAYKGDPRFRLKSLRCNVYKWKDKYIEADFDCLAKREMPQGLLIPVQKRKSVNFWEVGKVKEVL